jgi:RHS repeat-associated protein
VEQYVSGGSGNHTYYLPGNLEEVTPSGSLVKYYSAGGLNLGENTATGASGISYLADDGLGSVSEALNQTGTATGSLLYGPYGNVRYTNGTMPTSKGFTGQYADASTGLDYYGARYYDPSLGQFVSSDSVGGLNRYGYVAGNPETNTDPTGHRIWTGGNDSSAGNFCPGPVKPSGTSELGIAANVLLEVRRNAPYLNVMQKRLQTITKIVDYWDTKSDFRAAHGPGSIPKTIRTSKTQPMNDADNDAMATLDEANAESTSLNRAFGHSLLAIGAGMDGFLAGRQQWIEDDGKYGFGQHLARAAVADAVHGALSTGVAMAGAAVGGFIGTAVGMLVVGGVGALSGAVAGSVVPGLGTGVGALIGLDMGMDAGAEIGGGAGALAGAMIASNALSGQIDGITNWVVSFIH